LKKESESARLTNVKVCNRAYIVAFFQEFPCITQPFLIDAAESLMENGLLEAVFSATMPKPSDLAKLKVSRSLRKKIQYLPRGYLRYMMTGRILLEFLHACISNPSGFASLLKFVIRLRRTPSHALGGRPPRCDRSHRLSCE